MKARLSRVRHVITTPIRKFRKLRRRNKVLVIIALIIALFIISDQIQKATAKPPYVTEAAKKEDVVQIISETGNVNTGGRVDVYSTVTGIIEEIHVQNGTPVDIDQPLFSVRSTATDQEIAAANASYQGAVSSLKTAEQAKLAADAAMWTAQKAYLDAQEDKRQKDNNKNDYEDLEEKSIDSAEVQAQKNFQATETKYKEADIAVTAARAQVTSTKLAFDATKSDTVFAQTSGVVANLSVAVGDNVQAGTLASVGSGGSAALAAAGAGGTMTGTPVLTIANLTSNFTIKLALNEVDIPKVNVGQPAVITFDAFSNKKYRGTVTHVDSVGTNNQGVVTYNVLVSITNPDTGLRPGMTADVDIEVDREVGVLTVPNSAVKPYKGGKAVRIVDPKTKELKFITVEVGIKGETKTEIIKGINEGQEVVTALTNDQVERPGPF